MAIVGILSAIAVSNFLLASTRAKTSQAKAALSTTVQAIETYRTDHQRYPRMTWADPPFRDRSSMELGRWITTPVAYLTQRMVDPFGGYGNSTNNLSYFYPSYHELATHRALSESQVPGVGATHTSVLRPSFPIAFAREAGGYAVSSVGPDLYTPDSDFLGYWMAYDPTNGVRSAGNLWRTQRHSEPTHLDFRDAYPGQQ